MYLPSSGGGANCSTGPACAPSSPSLTGYRVADRRRMLSFPSTQFLTCPATRAIISSSTHLPGTHRACPPPHYRTRHVSTTPRLRCHRTHTVPTDYRPPHRTHRADYRPPHHRSSLPSHRQRLRGRSDRCDRRTNRARQCGGRGSAAGHSRAVPGALRVLRARTALQSVLRCGRGGASGRGECVPEPPMRLLAHP